MHQLRERAATAAGLQHDRLYTVISISNYFACLLTIVMTCVSSHIQFRTPQFTHHLFALEQNEYEREGIDWTKVGEATKEP